MFPAIFLLGFTGLRPLQAADEDTADADRVIVTGADIDRLQDINPGTGTRIYRLSPEVIDNQGRGQDAGLDEVLVHAPGVSRESGGQYHLRGEDYGLQYRLNGIQLPEGIASSLGQSFDTRLIDTVTVISGALPAQYGLRNAGVIDLQTKSGADLRGSEADVYGGSHAILHPSYSLGGDRGGTDFFITAGYLQDELGVDNVTPGRDAIHDQTRQYQEFALVTRQIAPGQKLSLLFSGVDARFEIPTERGLSPVFSVEGATAFDSTRLDRNQREQNYYGIAAYQFDTPAFSLLLAEVNSYSSTHYQPDPLGDLVFTGVASDARRDLLGTGAQADASWRTGHGHTLRAGLTINSQAEQSRARNTVFETDPATGEAATEAPETLTTREHQRGYLYGVYLQDEWQIIDHLSLNLGGRFDGVSAYVHENAFSPRVSLTWRPAAAWSIHAGYARIFSPPLLEHIPGSAFARYVNTTNAPDSLADDAARSERAHSFDVGAACEALPGLTLGVDAYYKSVRNMQDEEQLGASLLLTPFTYRRGDKEGVEFTADYHRGAWLLYANVALAETKGRKINSAQGLFAADELQYISRHDIHADYDQGVTISAGAVWHWRSLALHSDLLFGSGFCGGFANSDALPSHATVNVGASWLVGAVRGVSLSVRCDVINLFDRSYLLHDAGIGATVNQYGERRGVFGGLRCNF